MVPRKLALNGLTLHPLHVPLRIALAVAVMAVLVAPGPAAAKKPAFLCKSAPGHTYVTWRDESRATRIDLAWGDGDGNPISEQTLITSEERHSTFKTDTPAGAVEFGVTFYDATGAYAVGGMVCQ
jgi:hypothetical protein